MAGLFHHEQLYRGADTLRKLEQFSITICGAGALGSQLADNLVRQNVKHMKVIDFDRIESHNVGTQLYTAAEAGRLKVDALCNRLFQTANVEIETTSKKLTDRNSAKFLKGADLVLETFDNSESRSIVQTTCRDLGLPCLHVGLAADYAEVIWDQRYQVPKDTDEDECNYPLARNLVLLAVAVATEAVIRFVTDRTQEDHAITLRDFAITPMETVSA